jgi:hypothetical protein
VGAGSEGYYTAAGPTFMLPDCFQLISGLRVYVDQTWGLHVEKRPILLGADGTASGPVTLRLRDDGAALPLVDGEPLSSGERSFDRWVSLRGNGWRLEHRGRGSVTVSESGDVALFLRQEAP